jgi:hypothetical protein
MILGSSNYCGDAMTEGWITVTEAAAAIHRSYGATLRLVLIGELQGARREGRWRVSESSVTNWLEARDASLVTQVTS